jgi:DNA-binding transcriptional MerR regulator
MNIGEAAARSGVPAKTIRYYDEIDLIRPPGRGANGYRAFAETDVHKRGFLQRARSLGFTIKDCRALLSLYDSSADVSALAQAHLEEIVRKIDALESLRAALSELVDTCSGDSRPDRPIHSGLAGTDKEAP